MASSNGNGQPDLVPFYPVVRDYLRRFECHEASAEDLTQRTYAHAYQWLEKGSVHSNVRSWLLGIARNVGYDQVRSDHRRHPVALDDAIESVLYDESVHEPIDNVLDAETKARLQGALEHLTREQQLFVRAYYAPDRHLYDPVTQFGIPARIAKVRMYKLRKRLRKMLEGLDVE